MATDFKEIIDLAMTEIDDYRLDEIARKDYQGFIRIMSDYIKRAIPKFIGRGCRQSLEYEYNENSRSNNFKVDLTSLEKEILAAYTTLSWFTGIVQDLTQFSNNMQNKEYKTHSQAENLKQKSEYKDKLNEKVDTLVTDYQNINIKDDFLNGKKIGLIV